MVQRYKFESKSQLALSPECRTRKLFPMVQRYKFESKSQRAFQDVYLLTCCFQWFKDTNLKVNHNFLPVLFNFEFVVSNGSKIQI